MQTFQITKRLFFLICTLQMFGGCTGQTATNGVPTASAKAGQIVTELDSSIWSVFCDSKHNYWFASNGSGVYCYNGKTLTRFTGADGLNSDQVRSIQEDNKGNIYINTPKGITKYDGKSLTQLIPIQSNDWQLRPNDLWFNGNGEINGVYRYDGDTLHHLQFPGTSSNGFDAARSVYAIYKDKKNCIWFGTLTAGACRFNGTAFDWLYEKELSTLEDGRVPAVRSILEDKDGFYWLSNLLYKYKINASANHKMQYKKSVLLNSGLQKERMLLPYYTSAVIDKNNVIWMSNYNEGVWKFDGVQLTNYPIRCENKKPLVVSLYIDKEGVIWLATDNAGVFKDNGKAFEKVNFK